MSLGLKVILTSNQVIWRESQGKAEWRPIIIKALLWVLYIGCIGGFILFLFLSFPLFFKHCLWICALGRVWLFFNPIPLSLRFPRQEYWSGLPFHPPGDLHDPGIELHVLCLLHWQAGSLPTMPPGNSFLSIRSFFIKWNFTKDPILFFSFFWPYHMACGILVPQSGIEFESPALVAWSLNHWTTREVSVSIL